MTLLGRKSNEINLKDKLKVAAGSSKSNNSSGESREKLIRIHRQESYSKLGRVLGNNLDIQGLLTHHSQDVLATRTKRDSSR